MLTDTQHQLWATCLEKDANQIRSESLSVLAKLIESLENTPREQWQDWALDICRRVLDEKEAIPVRTPFFQKILFPALLSGYRFETPGCARWLAGFFDQVAKAPGCLTELGQHHHPASLLREAIQADPADHRSQYGLMNLIANWLRNSLHELPSGVLYEQNGATIQQCHELRSELDEFCRLTEATGQTDTYAELIKTSRYHFTAYQQYLENLDRYSSYQEYLSLHMNE